VIILHQSFFSASVDLKTEAIQTSITFFDAIFEKYSEKMLMEMKGRMGRDESVPLLVTQANYGRLLIMTLTENFIS
jgi:predicted transcriptional regulator